MKIALDYDGTYTADPALWDRFISLAKRSGHEVHIVTMRYPSEPIKGAYGVTAVHYTSRLAKAKAVAAKGLAFDVWIDDRPELILLSCQP